MRANCRKFDHFRHRNPLTFLLLSFRPGELYGRRPRSATTKHIPGLPVFGWSRDSQIQTVGCLSAAQLTIRHDCERPSFLRCTPGKIQELGIDLQKNGPSADAMHKHAPDPSCRERQDRRGEASLCVCRGSVASCMEYSAPRRRGPAKAGARLFPAGNIRSPLLSSPFARCGLTRPQRISPQRAASASGAQNSGCPEIARRQQQRLWRSWTGSPAA